MRVKWKFFVKIFSAIAVTFLFCEYLIYYLVISQCSWPKLPNEDNNQNSIIKAMFLADTHLLGPYRGHWFDKLRREWQMHRAFQSAVTLYNPEIVFFLGDLFDEGLWSNKDLMLKYFKRFFSLFEVSSQTQVHVVPGNHDIGFHYEIHPYSMYYFEELFNISSVQLLNIKGNYFVLINSMAMEGDNCYLCAGAEKKIKSISAKLNCAKDPNCTTKKKLQNYSRPIVLLHFPMYRNSDSKCNERDEAPLSIKNTKFKEKWDCLSKEASEMIFNELNPRLILNGHTHHGCHVMHRKDIHEYTLPSFSWRNKNNPTFMLAKISPTNFTIQKCDMPRESTVIFIYSCAVLILSVCIIYSIFRRQAKLKCI